MICGRSPACYLDDQEIRERPIAKKNCRLMRVLCAFANFEQEFEARECRVSSRRNSC